MINIPKVGSNMDLAKLETITPIPTMTEKTGKRGEWVSGRCRMWRMKKYARPLLTASVSRLLVAGFHGMLVLTYVSQPSFTKTHNPATYLISSSFCAERSL